MATDSDRMHFLDLQRDPHGSARRIVAAYDAAEADMGATCAAIGVSRNTLHRWLSYLRCTQMPYDLDAEMNGVAARHADAVHARRVATGELGGRPPVKLKRRRAQR